jgi:hypothetical protein
VRREDREKTGTRETAPSGRSRAWVEALILGLALVHGLLYLIMVPPWQHYDEPGHFEYSWLIANRGKLPKQGDYDQEMRREVAASMLEHDFFRDSSYHFNLLASDEPVWIAIPQLEHPPFYYMLTALPLRIFRHADITFQLYVARSVSLILYLLSIWIAGRLVGNLVTSGSPLRWAVPGMMALLPAYTDLMTAVNNDVGATVVFSLFLWGAVRLIRHGISVPRLAWVLGTAVLGVWTKNTAVVALLLAPLALALARVRGRRSLWVWGGVAVAGMTLIFVAFSWGDAASWYRVTDQESPTRQSVKAAPLGQYVLAIEMTAEEPSRQIMQPLLQRDVEALREQTVTLGAWMWASQPMLVRSPMLYDGRQYTWEAVEVGTIPTFRAITTKVAADVERIEVVLQPLLDDSQKEAIIVHYDGVVLVEGEWPLDRPPAFDDPEGREGSWERLPFVNQVRNSSAERAWPRARPWVDKSLRKYVRLSPTQFMVSLLDWQFMAQVYPLALQHLLYTFWARFGWSQVKMSEFWFWACSGWTAWAMVGTVNATWNRLKSWLREKRWQELNLFLFIFASLALVWLVAILRVDIHYLSPARYTYPAISIFILAFVEGFRTITTRIHPRLFPATLLLCLTVLDGAALLTQMTFYYGR